MLIMISFFGIKYIIFSFLFRVTLIFLIYFVIDGVAIERILELISKILKTKEETVDIFNHRLSSYLLLLYICSSSSFILYS